MRTRKIGKLEVSVVGLGCNNFGGRIDDAQATSVVNACIDAGITFFDTADVYGGTRSEEVLGAALGDRRGQVVVASKFGMQIDDQRRGAKPDYVRRAIEDTLRRLGTDYVDLYQLHFPDADTPIGDTLAALDELVQAGKVREIGCSNFSAAQLREAEEAVAQGAARFVSVQNQYSLLQREPEADLLGECARDDVAFIPYFPLASGVLTGKYRRGEPVPPGTRLASMPDRAAAVLSDETFSVVEALTAFANERGHNLVELAVAWLLAHQVVASVIAGATRPEQVDQNAAGADWVLSDADVAEIDALAPRP